MKYGVLKCSKTDCRVNIRIWADTLHIIYRKEFLDTLCTEYYQNIIFFFLKGIQGNIRDLTVETFDLSEVRLVVKDSNGDVLRT